MQTPYLTICTAPKPFTDPHISKIQRNALRSWQALGDEVEVVVLGSDEGIAENTKELSIRHIPEVEVNQKGTPLISSMLAIARDINQSPYLAIINADIIIFDDMLTATKKTAQQFDQFLIIGQRWDMEILNEISTQKVSLNILREQTPQKGVLHPPMGSDYFVFPRSCYRSIPDFAIGRAGWDNWFIYKSRLEGWQIIDATSEVRLIHQNHDYGHLPGGQPHYRLPETKENVKKGGGEHTIFSIFDAQFEFNQGIIQKKSFSAKKIFREIEISPITKLHSEILGKIIFYLFRPKLSYRKIRKKLAKKG